MGLGCDTFVMHIFLLFLHFQVVKTPNRGEDIIPPSRILDLNVDKFENDIDHSSVKLTVSFISPGDDFDEGIGMYVINYFRCHSL